MVHGLKKRFPLRFGCTGIALSLAAANVGQAFQPDRPGRSASNADPVRLESLTYVSAPKERISAIRQATKPKFELKDGDRVVFLGNTLIEREQQYGYWETMLTARYPDRKILFRNLGWDGDTVWAESRGLFDPPEKGYARMLAHVGRIKPTVLFLGYGNNEAFAGKPGLPRFVKQYNKLLDDLTRVSAKGVRFVLLSPTLHEDPRELRIDALFKVPALEALKNAVVSDDDSSLRTKRYNESAILYSKTIRSVAQKRGSPFVGLAEATRLPNWGSPWTSNGMHLSKEGYESITADLRDSLGLKFPDAWIRIDVKDGKITRNKTQNATVELNSKAKGMKFRAAFKYLPAAMSGFDSLMRNTMSVEGLPINQYYSLKIDGIEIADRHSGSGGRLEKICYTWRNEVPISTGPDFDQAEDLRQTIIAKNRLYFHSWRPQNITYLFLFRKHEQGQNAKEMQEFQRLVAAKEKEIDRLKKPVTRTYELVRVKPKAKGGK